MSIQSFTYHSDLLSALLWQYENAPNINLLAKNKSAFFQQATVDFWHDWYRDVFNIDSANEFGLAVWGRILDTPLGIDITSSHRAKIGFGFSARKRNFRATFRRNSNYTLMLTKEQQRLLVRLRYFKLTTSPTISNINTFLTRYLSTDTQRVYVLDGLDMSIIYVFRTRTNEALRLLLENFDLLPRPAGVQIKIRLVYRKAFGFGNKRQNFTANYGY